MLSERARCMCCGFLTLEQPDANILCPVCWWQDDGQDDEDADVVRGTANGNLSLTMARANFARCGAADDQFISHVREALPAERTAA